ncbi:Glucose 1-dehydrogenase 2 [Marinibacterium anthonyi]|nr:Glucose 1-dehydrogenase 2 [Marinibacterium anthonyi]
MKTIIITGASSGIGAATARHFLENGWTTGLIARREGPLKDLSDGHPNAIVLPCDVTDPAAVETAFDSFVAQTGRLDMLFNNAGMFGVNATIDEVPVETWLQVVNVNLTGMFLSARQAFKHMRAQDPQGGRIVNNGSISAHVPRDGSICYTSTKHAITGMTRTLSLDGRPFDIACGQIDIGNARTEMVDEQNRRQIAAGREPDPSMDVSNVVKALMYMADLPLEANVQFMTVMATKMPYIGRG